MQRWPAVKLWIENIKNSKSIFDAGRLVGIEFNGKIVNRVNIVANVIDKFEGENLTIITVDDSTGVIEIRDFEKDLKVDIGDVIVAIGLLKNYNEKIYIAKEIVKKVNPLWLIARKLELEKFFGLRPSFENETKNENKYENKKENENGSKLDEDFEHVVLEKIKAMAMENDAQEVDVEELYLQLDFPVQKIKETLEKLIDDAKIYEPRPGIIKLF